MTTTESTPKRPKVRGRPRVVRELPRSATWPGAIANLKDHMAAHVAAEQKPLDWEDDAVFDPAGHLIDRDYAAMERLRGVLIREIVTELAKEQPYTVRRFLECYLLDTTGGDSNVWYDWWATEQPDEL